MLEVSRLYRLHLEKLALSTGILREIPMWDHIIADKTGEQMYVATSMSTVCLRDRHDLELLVNLADVDAETM